MKGRARGSGCDGRGERLNVLCNSGWVMKLYRGVALLGSLLSES